MCLEIVNNLSKCFGDEKHVLCSTWVQVFLPGFLFCISPPFRLLKMGYTKMSFHITTEQNSSSSQIFTFPWYRLSVLLQYCGAASLCRPTPIMWCHIYFISHLILSGMTVRSNLLLNLICFVFFKSVFLFL